MQGIEMWIYFPAKQRIPKVSGIMRQKIHSGIAAHQPAGEEVNRQWKAVHLDKERDNKGRESAKGTPIPLRPGLGEAESEDNENQRVDHHQGP